MAILGKNSGFKTFRDLMLFMTGLGICIFHVLTVDAPDLSLPLLLFGGGLAGAPSVLKLDEKREKTNAPE